MKPVNPKIILPLGIFFILNAAYNRSFVEPREEAMTAALKNLTSSTVREIIVSPDGRENSIETVHHFKDPSTIDTICELFSESTPGAKKCRTSRWGCNLEFVTDEKSWEVQISDAGRVGVLAYVTGGNNLENKRFLLIRELIVGEEE